MAIPLMTISGEVVDAPRYKRTGKGMPVIHLRLRATDRRQGEDGQWHDGDEYLVQASAYKDLAENIRDSIRAGDMVICSGRIRTETWKDATGQDRVTDKFILSDCGLSLKLESRPRGDVESQAQSRNQR